MAATKRVLIVAGGTGGHVYPGLALAQELKTRGLDVHWLGTDAGIESRIVPLAGITLHKISISGVRGKGALALLKAPINIARAIWQSVRVVRMLNCDLVVGLGGFVSGPGGVAAKLCAKPLVIHEQNAVAGTTNKLLSRIANRVLSAFPNVLPKSRCIGNPVREAFFNRDSSAERSANKIRILVVGGSRGARAINQLIPEAIDRLADKAGQIEVFHQTGEFLFEEAQNSYKKLGINYSEPALAINLLPFVDDIAQKYQWADLVICRAGALTIAELAVAGVASYLVPFPYAIDDHQTANGQYLAEAGAAKLWQQNELTADILAKELRQILEDPSVLKRMGELAMKCGKTNAVKDFADECQQLITNTATMKVLL